MTLSTESTATTRHSGVSAKQVLPILWRVIGSDNSVRGHIRLVDAKHGQRFASTLILPGGVRTMFLGEFWSLEDALDCFA
ncbi:MAG: hypothetical protein ACOYBP_07740 [Microbacteriaceae bacterium]